MPAPLFTIGHSNHELDYFLGLLKQHGITAVADVRSVPWSRFVPHFNRDALKESVEKIGIAYVYLGKELGGRSDNRACYNENGRIEYARLIEQPDFLAGMERIKKGMQQFRVALMCAEKRPTECHRTLLLARYLTEINVPITHIHADGKLETQKELELRMLEQCELPTNDLFRAQDEMIDEAYQIQSDRVAYVNDAMR